MRNFWPILLLINATICLGQIESIVASSGTSATTQDLRLDWVLGDILIDHYTTQNIDLEAGFLHLFNEDLNTAVSELNISAEVSLFPNPSSDILNIEIGNTDKYQLDVLFMDGRKMLSITIRSNENIEVVHWPEGSYLIIIRNEFEYGVYSFVKS